MSFLQLTEERSFFQHKVSNKLLRFSLNKMVWTSITTALNWNLSYLLAVCIFKRLQYEDKRYMLAMLFSRN